MFTSDILQRADAVCGVVIFGLSPWFQAIVRLFLLRERCKIFRHSVLLYQINASVCRFAAHFSGIYVVPLTSFSTYRKRLPNLCNVSWLWPIIRRIWANRNGMLYHWRRFPLYRKRLPNLSNASWLRKIFRWIWANQKRINILNEW